MSRDRITEIWIRGLRTIEKLHLRLDGLTVLIGENGVGKSSVLEAIEILRRMAGPKFFTELLGIHGGLEFSLLRLGTRELVLGLHIEGSPEDGPIQYEVTVAQEGLHPMISSEILTWGPGPKPSMQTVISRSHNSAAIYSPPSHLEPVNVSPGELALTSRSVSIRHAAVFRLIDVLEGIETHLPFEVLPAWAGRALGRRIDARSGIVLQQVDRLDLIGGNLANAFYRLKNEIGGEHWRTTEEYIRLGLGDDVETINIPVKPEGGAISLSIKLKNQDRQIPASALSDGQLAFLSFVALYRLPSDRRSLLTFDEPDLHLHPSLLTRIVGLFESMAEDCPVILATQSDRLLDALQNPARSVRVCELDGEQHELRLRQLDPEQLADWLEDYRGVGELRGAGYLSRVTKGDDLA